MCSYADNQSSYATNQNSYAVNQNWYSQTKILKCFLVQVSCQQGSFLYVKHHTKFSMSSSLSPGGTNLSKIKNGSYKLFARSDLLFVPALL